MPISFEPLLCEEPTLSTRENHECVKNIHQGKPAYLLEVSLVDLDCK
jgi:hypothetical protein